MASTGGISERDLMVSLKVISKLRTHEKLSTKGDAIRIEPSQSFWSSWSRWWRSESRQHNISTIEGILDAAFSQLHLRMSKSSHVPEDWIFFDRLSAELERTAQGIVNLQQTYGECSLTTATLDCVLEKITSNMERYRNFRRQHEPGIKSEPAAAAASPRPEMSSESHEPSNDESDY